MVGFFALSEFYGGSCIVLVVIWRELQEIVGITSELSPQTPVVHPSCPGRIHPSMRLVCGRK